MKKKWLVQGEITFAASLKICLFVLLFWYLFSLKFSYYFVCGPLASLTDELRYGH